MSNTVILLMVTMVPVIVGTGEQTAYGKEGANSQVDHLANFDDYPVSNFIHSRRLVFITLS